MLGTTIPAMDTLTHTANVPLIIGAGIGIIQAQAVEFDILEIDGTIEVRVHFSYRPRDFAMECFAANFLEDLALTEH